ncbi:MAG: hypothetical protein KIT60_07105 [Burkholderiaceae bacterium]|nr:hypothetical protein [Burkholderiaceae bacterium]
MSEIRETLRQKQSRFARAVAELVQEATRRGYEVTWGEAWRSEWEATRLAKARLGIRRSLHCDRLAVDLNLFRGGVWLEDTEDHRPLGEWWEQHFAGAAWGGRFGDGNHYSFEHEGRR